MNNPLFAFPQCVVEIYQADGGVYSLQAGQIVSCTTDKSVYADSGNFQILLAPGGPNGTNTAPSWTQVIAPLSLVLIGMQRDDAAEIVMIGIVTDVSEDQQWAQGQVTRSIQISGTDLSYFFTIFNYYTFGLLGLTSGSVLGEAIFGSAVALPALLSQGLFNGTAQQIAVNFFTEIMVGGIMKNTSIPFQNTRISLQEAFATNIEEFPTAYVLFDNDFVSTEGTWIDKFKNILQFPFYEFFITSVPIAAYGAVAGQPGGYNFKMKTLNAAPPSVPVLVGRINPLPFLTATVNGDMGATITGIDSTAWDALNLYELPGFGFRESNISFGIGDTANFFAINPTTLQSLFGASNSQLGAFWWTMTAGVDPSSIIEFGYRPAVLPTQWFNDPNGVMAQNLQTNDFSSVLLYLLTRVAAQYGPLHLMASGTCRIQLQPDMLPGNVFRYAPFKGDATWDFYIDEVEHEFTFGGESATVLTLSRGLPTSVYADKSAGGMLQSVYDGTVRRIDGKYQKVQQKYGGLQLFGPGSNIQQLIGSWYPAFQQPQQK